MQNIIEYVQSNINTMSQKKFNPVDSLVLSKLSYIRFEGIVPQLPKKARAVKLSDMLKAEMFGSMLKYMSDPDITRNFICAVAASPRYRNIKMKYYTEKTDAVAEKQFAAVTFLLEDKTAYIAFRGTDVTLVGWKEDFNMAFISPVPSQEESAKYLNTVSRLIPRSRKLRVGGHSKGGNLAVYSSVKCKPSASKRIISVFNHDGPGFKNNIFDSTECQNIKGRIHTTVPEESLIGMLLQYDEDYWVISSSQRGIMQHDPFTWDVKGDDFAYVDKVKSSVLGRNKVINEWLNTLSDEKRKVIVESMFQILSTTEADTFQELSDNWRKNASAMLGAIKEIDPESKKFITKTIAELAKMSVKNIFKSN